MLLDAKNFLVKEQVAFLKTVDTYDIYDVETEQQVGVAKEDPGTLIKWLRWVLSKKLMPTKVFISNHPSGDLVFSIRKPVTFFRQRVEVFDADGQRLGYFKSKIFSLGGGFYVYDDKDKEFAEVKGKWTGWEFRFVTPDGEELGKVSKKWAGLGKALFTSADNYVVSIDDNIADQPVAKMLLLAATLAIDMVYYENKG